MGNLFDFATAVRNPQPVTPPGLYSCNGSAVDIRFGVYRNNFWVSCIDVLADTFPVTQALVGEEFFRACARAFVINSPPRSPVLVYWGADFPDFLSRFEPTQHLGYLPHVARLEFLRLQSYYAADAKAISEKALSAVLATDAWVGQKMQLHPSLCLFRAPCAALAIWQAHQLDEAACKQALPRINLKQAEQCLIFRFAINVLIQPVDAAMAVFVETLLSGCTVQDALDQTQKTHTAFDPSQTLALLLQRQLLLGFAVVE